MEADEESSAQKREIVMKTLVGVLIAGALSTTGALAGAAGTSSDVAKTGTAVATPQVPFRPLQKRPSGARAAAAAAPKVNSSAPQLPFRPYQKRPAGAASNKPGAIETPKEQ